ncbi:3-isopropylmalate dehydratase large subunit [Desulfobacterium sp. N47]|uniref:3-isopropylmalate dehydratase large subunit n=1 Tax=uncultured Desulfobacterium sp. TaxID=201089 RepID=E1YDS9_9BACT|nr:3-isopropylmalate dehydratase large subunit [uncultured Desulfobacterium sp.]
MGKTIAQKIFDSHIIDNPFEDIYVIRLDAVFCHEITTPIAINDLVSRSKDRVFDTSRIKAVIDHVTPAKDSKTALQGKILREWARRHKINDFFDIGRNGVCHAIFPEKGFVRPGYTIIMGDSHTCTYGAFGAFGAGVGTTDLEVGILKGVCALGYPETIKINICGKMPDGVFAKDIILSVIGLIGVSGATNKVLEFSGPVVEDMGMDARMTLCNMAIEAGATCGICAPDMTTVEYLWDFIKNEYKTKDAAHNAFSKYCSDPDASYEKIIDHDITNLEPVVTFGYKPDKVKPVKEMEGTKIDQVYIGSCTNGRIEDLRVAAKILKGNKISDSLRGIVSPATTDIYKQALDEGIIADFLEAGFCVTNPTCGACLGMSNGIIAEGETCASTTNRNFSGRMGKGGMVHLMSPATAAATAIAGHITNSKLYKGK